MKLLLVVATPDDALQSLVAHRKEDLLPAQVRTAVHSSLPGSRLSLACYLGTPGTARVQFTSFMSERLDATVTGVIVAVDRRLVTTVRGLEDICFIVEYDAPGTLRSPSNFFGANLTKAVRDYLYLARRFDDAKDQKLITLPFRNFRAAELAHLRAICIDPGAHGNYNNVLDLALKALRARQKPKRFKDAGKEVYLVDDDRKHFIKGHERHAQADTKIPPHHQMCLLGNMFRFGRRFDGSLHYNVSMGRSEERMDSHYPDCHDVARQGSGSTHLNMFSNDFF